MNKRILKKNLKKENKEQIEKTKTKKKEDEGEELKRKMKERKVGSKRYRTGVTRMNLSDVVDMHELE
jgi:hypothetical protein